MGSIYPPLLDRPSAAVAEVAKISANSQDVIQNRQVFLIQSTPSSKLTLQNETTPPTPKKKKKIYTFPLVYTKTWNNAILFFLLQKYIANKRKFIAFGDDIRVSHFSVFYLILQHPFSWQVHVNHQQLKLNFSFQSPEKLKKKCKKKIKCY